MPEAELSKPEVAEAPSTQPSRKVQRALFWLRRLIAASLLAIAISFPWRAYTKNRFYPVNFGVVEPGLFRSGQLSQGVVRDALEKNHIDVIVNLCRPDESNANVVAEEKAATDLGIDRESFPLRGDGRGDPNMYVKAVQKIIAARQANKTVLVHCAAGEMRTTGVIAAYQVIVEGKSEEDAFQQARRYNFDPKRNTKLRPYFDLHLPEWKAALAPQQEVSTR